MNLPKIIANPSTTIIDVRTKEEFMSGHVDGSINFPLDEVVERIEDFKKMSGSILLCCVSGARSGQAESYLRYHGIENVYNGGSWMDINYLKYKAA